ncbi:MAG: aerobic carbon-monoxide dehydrogenase small subunit [Chloroflexota bacterium]|jgi:carbon-monoxide dehydrogenase small subunit|nr:aerobic carbon-monoxide dehydrogenase small subunit [Chloroflexota bacterium]
MKMPISMDLNGRPLTVDAEPYWTLQHLLRDELDLTGTKEGCRTGNCGVCTVLIDGKAVKSCLVLAPQVAARQVTTVEGLAHGEELDPLQRAFAECGAIQCGYCSPGFIMAARAFLNENPSPTRAEIADALEGNLCRCTGYVKIFEAVETAARVEAHNGHNS